LANSFIVIAEEMASVQPSSIGGNSMTNQYSKQASLADCENQTTLGKSSSIGGAHPNNMANHKPGQIIAASHEEGKTNRTLGQDVTNTFAMTSNRNGNVVEAGEKDAPVKMNCV
jgi:hypothetical protein